MKEVGIYTQAFNSILGINLPLVKIFASDGLKIHIAKRHPGYEKYLNSLADIIKSPDYIGVNPTEPNSIELIKRLDENIQIAIKLDIDKNYLYVASLYDISESKIERRLQSGRLKIFSKNLDIL
ncbi:MAG: PBECR2 nuclease fold domain-containing protein [Clostridia bacterium]|nr:PBECR2 nuclease fold domain-containing protein [Clostridia bacterium]